MRIKSIVLAACLFVLASGGAQATLVTYNYIGSPYTDIVNLLEDTPSPERMIGTLTIDSTMWGSTVFTTNSGDPDNPNNPPDAWRFVFSLGGTGLSEAPGLQGSITTDHSGHIVAWDLLGETGFYVALTNSDGNGLGFDSEALDDLTNRYSASVNYQPGSRGPGAGIWTIVPEGGSATWLLLLVGMVAIVVFRQSKRPRPMLKRGLAVD